MKLQGLLSWISYSQPRLCGCGLSSSVQGLMLLCALGLPSCSDGCSPSPARQWRRSLSDYGCRLQLANHPADGLLLAQPRSPVHKWKAGGLTGPGAACNMRELQFC